MSTTRAIFRGLTLLIVTALLWSTALPDELIIDLRVARELGIKVPPDLLYRADEVIR